MSERKTEKSYQELLVDKKKKKLFQQVNHLKWMKQKTQDLKQNTNTSQENQKILKQTSKTIEKNVMKTDESALKNDEQTKLFQKELSNPVTQEENSKKRPFHKLILCDQLQNQLLEMQKQCQKKKKLYSPEKCNESTCIEISSNSEEQLAKQSKESRKLSQQEARSYEQATLLDRNRFYTDDPTTRLFSKVKVTYVYLNTGLAAQLTKQQRKFDESNNVPNISNIKVSLKSKFVKVAQTAPICMIIEKVRSQQKIEPDIKNHKFFIFKGSLQNLHQNIVNSFSNDQTSRRSDKFVNLQILYDWYTLAHLLSWSSNIVIVVEKNVTGPFIEDYYQSCKCKNFCALSCLCLRFGGCKKTSNQRPQCIVQFHKERCKYSKPFKPITKSQMPQFDEKRAIGLTNARNSCFMNTALQCLVACKPLTQYFLQKEHLKTINLGNSFGTFGQITTSFSQFLIQYYTTKESAIDVERLKKVLCRWDNKYLLKQQQDSQQFLIRLLDWMKEDLNLNQVRPQYILTEDSQELAEQKKAQKAWKTQLARNNSIIEYLMAGVLKSQIQCTQCSYKSVNFENFLTLPLPVIKSNQHWTFTLKVSIVYDNFNRKNETANITLRNFRYKSVLNQVKITFGLKNTSQLIGIVYQLSTGSHERITNETHGKQCVIKCKENPNKNGLLFYEHKSTQLQANNIEVKFSVKTKQNQRLVPKSCQRYLFFSSQQGPQIKNVFKRLLIYFYSKMFKNNQSLTLPEYLSKFLNPQHVPFKVYLSKGNHQLFIQSSLYLIHKSQIDVVFENEEIFSPNQLARSVFLKKQNEKQGEKENVQSLNQMTIYDCLDEFQSTDIMDEENCWDCPKCKQKRKALKRISLYKTPKILILFFKRFQSTGQDHSHHIRKLQNLVSFDETIDLSGYVERKELPYTQRSQTLRYNLFAVANHFSIDSKGGQNGHYTACVSKSDRWHLISDEKVGQMEVRDVSSKNAYMLFYQRAQE